MCISDRCISMDSAPAIYVTPSSDTETNKSDRDFSHRFPCSPFMEGKRLPYHSSLAVSMINLSFDSEREVKDSGIRSRLDSFKSFLSPRTRRKESIPQLQDVQVGKLSVIKAATHRKLSLPFVKTLVPHNDDDMDTMSKEEEEMVKEQLTYKRRFKKRHSVSGLLDSPKPLSNHMKKNSIFSSMRNLLLPAKSPVKAEGMSQSPPKHKQSLESIFDSLFAASDDANTAGKSGRRRRPSLSLMPSRHQRETLILDRDRHENYTCYMSLGLLSPIRHSVELEVSQTCLL